jgi:hypothetical protein
MRSEINAVRFTFQISVAAPDALFQTLGAVQLNNCAVQWVY